MAMGNIGYIIDYKEAKGKKTISMFATENNEYYTESEIIEYKLATKEEINAAKQAGTPLEFVKAYNMQLPANNTRDLAKQFFKSEEAFVSYMMNSDIQLKNAAIVNGKLALSVKTPDGKTIKFASLKRFNQPGYKGVYPIVIVSEVYNTLGTLIGYRIFTTRNGKVNLVTKEKLIEYCDTQIIKALLVEKNRNLSEITDLFKPIQNAKYIVSRTGLNNTLNRLVNGDADKYAVVNSILNNYLTNANDIEESYLACYSVQNPFPREYISIADNKYTKDIVNKVKKHANSADTLLSEKIEKGIVDSYSDEANEFNENVKNAIREVIMARKAFNAKSKVGITRPTIKEVKKFIDANFLSEKLESNKESLLAKCQKVIDTESRKVEEKAGKYSELLEERAKIKLKILEDDTTEADVQTLNKQIMELDKQMADLESVMSVLHLKINRAKAEKRILNITYAPKNQLSKEQTAVLTEAKNAGVDMGFLTSIANPRLTVFRMQRLIDLKSKGLPAEYLASPDWTVEQFNYLSTVMELGTNIEPLMNFEYNTYTMVLILKAIDEGIDPSSFADPSRTTSEIHDAYNIAHDRIWTQDLEIIEGTKYVRR